MAVFTEVSDKDARDLLRRVPWANSPHCVAFEVGIENTDYFLTTDQGEWVLSLFERLSAEQLPFYLYLMKHLAHKGIPVPDPQADEKSGDILHKVCRQACRRSCKNCVAKASCNQRLCTALPWERAGQNAPGRPRLRPRATQSAGPALVEMPRCPPSCPTWSRTPQTCCRPSWLSRTTPPPPVPTRPCPVARCTQTCSATT